MTELIIFCGLQASGKSTYYRLRFAATHKLLSKDRMPNARHKDARQLAKITEALAQGTSVVVDNTNPCPEVRAPLIATGHAAGARVVGYWFGADLRGSLARNLQRAGIARVPDIALYATRKRLVPPEYAEGFNAIYAVRILGAGVFAVEALPPAETDSNPARCPNV